MRHVLQECRWSSEAREGFRRECDKEVKIQSLLYEKEGIGWACKICMNLLTGGEGGGWERE